MVPVALLGYWLAVPRWGGVGAAWVTTLTLFAAGLACLLALHRLAGVAPPFGTALRSAAIAVGIFYAARLLPAGGWWLVIELPLLVVASVAAFLALGETSAEERAWLRLEAAALASRVRQRFATDGG